LRGISEYIATVIMIIVTLIAGLIMFLYVNSVVDTYYSSLSTRLTLIGGSIDVMAGYIANNTIIVIVSVDRYPVKIYSIYVNDTLYPYCRVYRGDGSIAEVGNGQGVEIPYLSIAIVKCPANNCSICDVKIVYSGGEIYAKASRIV